LFKEEDDTWLTACICYAGLYQIEYHLVWKVAVILPSVITKILYLIPEFTNSFVDDIAVHSELWKEHLTNG